MKESTKRGNVWMLEAKPEGRFGSKGARRAGINMKLLSLNRGAVHGYRCDDYEACNTVE